MGPPCQLGREAGTGVPLSGHHQSRATSGRSCHDKGRYHRQRANAPCGAATGGANIGKRNRPALSAADTPEQLRARLQRFVLAIRDPARQAITVPFPEDVTVLAGRLRRIRGR
jgi:hypothetical protein